MRSLFIVGCIAFCIGSLRSEVLDSLVATPLIIPAKYSHVFDSARTVYLPKGFRCTLFYAQKEDWLPRMLAIDPSGRLCVADEGNSQVIALPDNDHDEVADTLIPLAMNDGGAHSIAFSNGALYTAASTQVLKYEHPNTEGLYIDSSIFIKDIPNVPEGALNHFTRTILFDQLGQNIFLTVGAPCNACKEKETLRASILRFALDGTERRLFATGLRNPVGLTLDPTTNALWTSVAERNDQGANAPQELVTHVEDGGFYGWPLAYGDHVWDDFQVDSEYAAMLPITHADSGRVNAMKTADIYVDAHSTPLSLIFYNGKKFPVEYSGDLFITLHGSYPSANGRMITNGTKIMHARKVNDHWITTDFATGFLTDSITSERWARPCGIVIDSAGDIYFSSDEVTTHDHPAIFKISYVGENDVSKSTIQKSDLTLYPNPTTGIVSIHGISPEISNVQVLDVLGQKLMEFSHIHPPDFNLDLTKLIPGTYYIRFASANSVVTRKIVKD